MPAPKKLRARHKSGGCLRRGWLHQNALWRCFATAALPSYVRLLRWSSRQRDQSLHRAYTQTNDTALRQDQTHNWKNPALLERRDPPDLPPRPIRAAQPLARASWSVFCAALPSAHIQEQYRHAGSARACVDRRCRFFHLCFLSTR